MTCLGGELFAPSQAFAGPATVAAAEVVLLVDEDKFTRSAPVRLCGFDRLDRLVTDVSPAAAILSALAKHRVSLHIADQT